MSFADAKLEAFQGSKAYKALEGIAYLAPMSAPLVTTITDTDGEFKKPDAAYLPVGYVSTDGYTFSNDTDTEEVEAHGFSSAVRTDITKITAEVSFTAMNVFNANLIGTAYSMDLSEVKAGLNGEVTFDRPSLPEKQYYRLLVVYRDSATNVLRGKLFTKVALSELPEEVFSAEDAHQLELTFTAEVDEVAGTYVREFFSGKGFNAEANGFQPAA